MGKNNDAEKAQEIDRVIHEPARLRIVAQLYVVESADFTFLLNQLGFTWGNLSSHLARLEKEGYVSLEKEFVGKKPRTTLSLTDVGRRAFQEYRKTMYALIDGLPQ